MHADTTAQKNGPATLTGTEAAQAFKQAAAATLSAAIAITEDHAAAEPGRPSPKGLAMRGMVCQLESAFKTFAALMQCAESPTAPREVQHG